MMKGGVDKGDLVDDAVETRRELQRGSIVRVVGGDGSGAVPKGGTGIVVDVGIPLAHDAPLSDPELAKDRTTMFEVMEYAAAERDLRALGIHDLSDRSEYGKITNTSLYREDQLEVTGHLQVAQEKWDTVIRGTVRPETAAMDEHGKEWVEKG